MVRLRKIVACLALLLSIILLVVTIAGGEMDGLSRLAMQLSAVLLVLLLTLTLVMPNAPGRQLLPQHMSHRWHAPLRGVAWFHPFSLAHDIVFCIYVGASLASDAAGLLPKRPLEISICAYAMVVPSWLSYCMVLPCFSSGVLTVWLTGALAQDLGWKSRMLLQSVASMTGLGVCGLVLIPRCQFVPHQTLVYVAMIGALAHAWPCHRSMP